MAYHGIDYYGITIGIIAFFLIYLYSFFLLAKFNLKGIWIISLLTMSAVGHLLGALLLFRYSTTMGSDSMHYFLNATEKWNGLGYDFICFIFGYFKKYLLGNSLLGFFLLSGAIGLLASIFYFLTFKTLFDQIAKDYPIYLKQQRVFFYPALIILCWPSYFIWSAGLGKDNFTFLSISVFLFALSQKKMSLFNCSLLVLGCLLGFCSRPYLFFIMLFATCFFFLFTPTIKFSIKINILFLLTLVSVFLKSYLSHYAAVMFHFTELSYTNIANGIIHQQIMMQEASSSMPIPTYNPYHVFFYLPYLFLVNLLLPIGIGITNAFGWISSIENSYLLLLLILLIKNRDIFRILQKKITILNYFLAYFIVGMICLSLMNTNLGLAMREKMMYVPALLINIFLVFTYKKILPHQNKQEVS